MEKPEKGKGRHIVLCSIAFCHIWVVQRSTHVELLLCRVGRLALVSSAYPHDSGTSLHGLAQCCRDRLVRVCLFSSSFRSPRLAIRAAQLFSSTMHHIRRAAPPARRPESSASAYSYSGFPTFRLSRHYPDGAFQSPTTATSAFFRRYRRS